MNNFKHRLLTLALLFAGLLVAVPEALCDEPHMPVKKFVADTVASAPDSVEVQLYQDNGRRILKLQNTIQPEKPFPTALLSSAEVHIQ